MRVVDKPVCSDHTGEEHIALLFHLPCFFGVLRLRIENHSWHADSAESGLKWRIAAVTAWSDSVPRTGADSFTVSGTIRGRSAYAARVPDRSTQDDRYGRTGDRLR